MCIKHTHRVNKNTPENVSNFPFSYVLNTIFQSSLSQQLTIYIKEILLQTKFLFRQKKKKKFLKIPKYQVHHTYVILAVVLINLTTLLLVLL